MINLCDLTGRPKEKLIQKVLDLNKVKKDNLKFPMLWSEKIDGVFCLALKQSDVVTIFSRTGEIFTSMQHISEELCSVMDNDELIIFEAWSPATTDQATISGWCRDTKKQHPELLAACHDILQLDEFISGGQYGYDLRSLGLERRMARNTAMIDVCLIHSRWVHSLEEALQLTEQIWSRGGEGGILRDPNAVYMPGKRNQDIIKIKRGVSYDLQVISVYEGKGKYKGTLGGLTCRWKNDKVIEISGMTDTQRKEWWSNPASIIGKIVQVDAMCESSKGKLREPRFKGIRHDKTEGDF